MTGDSGGTRVVVLADDLIWQTRLASVLEALGAQVDRTRTAADFEAKITGVSFAIVDLTARAYQPVPSIELARAQGLRVLAVGQHDDIVQRKAALAAGAERVFAYRKLFEHGPATLQAWLEGDRPSRDSAPGLPAQTRAAK
jgi:DNA-binding response OmpR family regulator